MSSDQVLDLGAAVGAADPKSRPRQSALGHILARSNSIDLAIGLSRVYEFTKRDGGLVHTVSREPVMPHTYYVPTATASSGYQTGKRLETYRLSRNGSRTVDLPLGLTLLFGRSGSGKTRFAFEHLFCSNLDDGTFVFEKMFEPGDDMAMALVSNDHLRIPQLEADLAIDIASFITSATQQVMIIDSLRYLFYSSTGGSTGKGGVNMGLFMILSHLDHLAMVAGKRLVVVVNPLTDDETAFGAYVEAGLGAVSGVIVMHDYLSAEIATRYATTRDFHPLKLPRRTSMDVVRASAVDSAATLDMHSVANAPTPIFDRKAS